jgi:hypothetical protein
MERTEIKHTFSASGCMEGKERKRGSFSEELRCIFVEGPIKDLT